MEQWSVKDVHRDELIRHLLDAQWLCCSGFEDWDLEKDGTRIQLATELGEKGAKRTLIRVDGDASTVRADLG